MVLKRRWFFYPGTFLVVKLEAREEDVQLASIGWRPGMLLDAHNNSPFKKNYQVQVSIVLRLRNHDLEVTRLYSAPALQESYLGVITIKDTDCSGWWVYLCSASLAGITSLSMKSDRCISPLSWCQRNTRCIPHTAYSQSPWFANIHASLMVF